MKKRIHAWPTDLHRNYRRLELVARDGANSINLDNPDDFKIRAACAAGAVATWLKDSFAEANDSPGQNFDAANRAMTFSLYTCFAQAAVARAHIVGQQYQVVFEGYEMEAD
jgi:hypothetical protein